MNNDTRVGNFFWALWLFLMMCSLADIAEYLARIAVALEKLAAK